MSNAELEATREQSVEVRRLRDYLIERGFWVIDSPPHCRVKPDAMCHLLGDISTEALRKRVKRGTHLEPVKIGHRDTYRLLDYVLLMEFQRPA